MEVDTQSVILKASYLNLEKLFSALYLIDMEKKFGF
jgi:hypothetical protein